MKLKLSICCLLFLIFNVFSQEKDKDKRSQLRAFKIAYISQELELSATEAEKFWPIYTLFEEGQKKLRQEKMRSFMNRIEAGEIAKLTDKEATNFLNQMEQTEYEMFQLRKKFIDNLKVILPPIKIIKLKKAEEGFNKKLLDQYRKRRIEKE